MPMMGVTIVALLEVRERGRTCLPSQDQTRSQSTQSELGSSRYVLESICLLYLIRNAINSSLNEQEFPLHGKFEGQIVAFDGKHYKVCYPCDEDEEELSEYEFDEVDILPSKLKDYE